MALAEYFVTRLRHLNGGAAGQSGREKADDDTK